MAPCTSLVVQPIRWSTGQCPGEGGGSGPHSLRIPALVAPSQPASQPACLLYMQIMVCCVHTQSCAAHLAATCCWSRVSASLRAACALEGEAMRRQKLPYSHHACVCCACMVWHAGCRQGGDGMVTQELCRLRGWVAGVTSKLGRRGSRQPDSRLTANIAFALASCAAQNVAAINPCRRVHGMCSTKDTTILM